MDRMLYVAMSGAKQTMLAQASNAHNLANASTTSFRADLTAFSSMPINGPGYQSRVYAMATDNGVDLTPGPVMSTGRELDASINGEGWFAVQAADGGEGYTRAGDFKISPNGALMTGRGYPVLGNSGTPIVIPPAEKVDVGADGTISIRPVGQSPNALVIVDRIKMVNPQNSDLTKDIDGLIKLKNGGTADADANIRLLAGSLEGSNVNTVEAMVNMIALARQFETQVKLMHVADENDKSSTQLMRIG